jgi:hypothetical protein
MVLIMSSIEITHQQIIDHIIAIEAHHYKGIR